jgi:hypothetical protein
MNTQKNIPIAQIKFYRCTGKDRNGKRFQINSSNYYHICCINAYKGTLYAILDNGKKKVLKRYFN